MDNDPASSSKMKQGFRMKWYLKRYLNKTTLFATMLFLCCTYFFLQVSSKSPQGLAITTVVAPSTEEATWDPVNDNMIITSNVFNNMALRNQMLRRKVEKLKKNFQMPRSVPVSSRAGIKPNYRVHIFYYAWYGNIEYDGSFKHWNHSFVPNWKNEDHRVYPTGSHGAPNDIGSNYYPALGCYSSKDPKTINTHMKQMRDAGIGVLVLSWSPPNYPDSPDALIDLLFDSAAKYDLKIALHIEPYPARHPANLRSYLRDFLNRFGQHPALYKTRKPFGEKDLPVFYVYDSYLIPDYVWRDLLGKKGKLSVRDTDLNAIFIGLLVDLSHRTHIKKSHFDGFYTYFAANSFSYGSTWKNWKTLSRYAKQNNLVFSPSVGPGYIDTNIRPWNAQNSRHRRHGQYYDVGWRTALSAGTPYISITSFNEWHEGTQIEPAQSKSNGGFPYLDYAPEGQMFYINLTQFWVEQYEKVLKLGIYKE